MHQFRALQLDFGVIDFALPPDGDLVVFEINACLQLTNRLDAQAAGDPRYFEANNDEILEPDAAIRPCRAAHATSAPHAGSRTMPIRTLLLLTLVLAAGAATALPAVAQQGLPPPRRTRASPTAAPSAPSTRRGPAGTAEDP